MENKDFEILDTFQNINPNGGMTKKVNVYRLKNGEKFRITYENSNGFPLGFNSKKCIAQYSKKDSQWNNLEDISVLQMSMPTPSYYSSSTVTHMNEFFDRMEKRMVTIYS
jgi:hypothetical protein